MADPASSPLGGVDLGDIGAVLSAAAAQGGAAAVQEGAGGGAAASAPGGTGTSATESKAQGTVPFHSLDFILDIPLKVTVELGRTKMAVRDILQLAQGSVIELSKFAGEPLEVLINEKLIARGEVVVVNEKFGIRLTDILSPVERIEQLK